MHIRRRTATITVAAIVACGALAATASALFTSTNGKAQIQMHNRTSTDAKVTNDANWNFVPGAIVSVTVPARTTRLFNARFTAESDCAGPDGSWCTVQIVAHSGAEIKQLEPASGMDFAFDAAADGRWEGNAMERSIKLGPGHYRIGVQYAVHNSATAFRLDDYHLALETSAG